jgi:hypothetical protein
VVYHEFSKYFLSFVGRDDRRQQPDDSLAQLSGSTQTPGSRAFSEAASNPTGQPGEYRTASPFITRVFTDAITVASIRVFGDFFEDPVGGRRTYPLLPLAQSTVALIWSARHHD